MANTIKIKNSGTASAVPSSLEFGELGLNYTDGKIYFKNSSNVIVDYGTVVNAGASGASVTVSDTAPSGAGVGDIWYESDTGKMFVYYDSFWVETNGTGSVGLTGAGGAIGYWGSFWSTQNQNAASATTAYAVTLNNSDSNSNGVSVVSNSRVTHANAGVYNLQFSIQFLNVGNSDANTNVWFRKNGTDIPDSSSQCTVPAQHGGGSGQIILALNLMIQLAASDYIELVWQTESTQVSLETLAAGTTPTTPRTPSVIFTSQQVMYTQVGPAGPTGNTGATGAGVVVGGTTGQVLAKIDGTNYNTQWVTPTVYATTGKAIAMAIVFGG